MDSTFIEANAAMYRCERTMRHGGVSTDRRLIAGGSLSMNRPCRIVRKESGEDWRAYLQRLAAAEGLELKTREELARFDKQRKKDGQKTASNDEWESKTDADARIRKMLDCDGLGWNDSVPSEKCKVRSAK